MRSCSGWGLPSRPRRRDRWCALTAPFHPCPLRAANRAPAGGLLSVALSVGSRPLGVTQHPALWSSDFPRSTDDTAARAEVVPIGRDHLGDSEPRILSSVSFTNWSARTLSSRRTAWYRTRGMALAAPAAAACSG